MRTKAHEAQLALLPLSTAAARSLSDSVPPILEFRDARDWKKFHRPKELAAALAIEAAEVQELFLWSDPESTDDILFSNPERLRKLREEIADVAIYLLLLAHELRIDIDAAISEKIAANERRFPIESSRGVTGKFSIPRAE
jgi:NTP pyrophosphatase (non-canonical NTP hydrolase)